MNVHRSEVLSFRERTARIRWYDGNYGSPWKVYTYYLGRKKMEWEEEVSVSDIVVTNLTFTKTNRLALETKRRLKAIYA